MVTKLATKIDAQKGFRTHSVEDIRQYLLYQKVDAIAVVHTPFKQVLKYLRSIHADRKRKFYLTYLLFEFFAFTLAFNRCEWTLTDVVAVLLLIVYRRISRIIRRFALIRGTNTVR